VIVDVENNKCLQCGILIDIPFKGQYCSSKCYSKKRYWNNKKSLTEVSCLICKELFLPTKAGHSCCSTSCSKKLWYINNIEKAKESSNKSQKKRKGENPDLFMKSSRASQKRNQKWNNMKRRFGLTKENYLSLIESQNNKCRICNNILNMDKTTHIDHCHETGKVRGILCNSCNLGLGNFKDSIQNLYNAIHYLEQNK